MFVFAGTSCSLSPLGSPGHGSISSGSLVNRSPVEFPDTTDFLTKPSVNLHKPLGYTFSSPDVQQHVRTSTSYSCSRYCNLLKEKMFSYSKYQHFYSAIHTNLVFFPVILTY